MPLKAIRILRGVCINGPAYTPGTILRVPLDVETGDAQTVIRMGKAEACDLPRSAPASDQEADAQPEPLKPKPGDAALSHRPSKKKRGTP